ncbi:MAG: hypothetical protein OXF89_00745 [Rhodospirillaceae bacterium]|nr:hypothetical protein [Rhodospirillaceae bacterium]
MALMARPEYFLDRHAGRLPFFPNPQKVSHRLLPFGAVGRLYGDDMGNGFAVTGYRHGFAALDCAEQFRQTRFRFSGADGLHVKFSPVILTGYFN